MPVSHCVYQNSVQETGILPFSTKKPVENYKRKYISKCDLNNSTGLYLRPGVYFLWDPENPNTGIYLNTASIQGNILISIMIVKIQ